MRGIFDVLFYDLRVGTRCHWQICKFSEVRRLSKCSVYNSSSNSTAARRPDDAIMISNLNKYPNATKL